MAEQTAKTKKIFDGRYEIFSIVGRGARSVVYRAKLITPPYSELALKVLIDQKGKNTSSERLRREALAMVSCRHRYVARLDDFHSLGSLCYLAMEYASNSDLRAYLKNFSGQLPVEVAERFFKQAAEGLSFVHRAGIIHRDIKPENILVLNEKEIRITDFGVALLPGEECSIADLQSGIGTMNYMAPEILEGRSTDNRSDIYALGVVFYEMLGGKNPFHGSPLAKQIDIRKNEKFQKLQELNPEIPDYLSEIIHQCMHYNLDERFSSCDQILANLLNKRSEAFSKQQRAKPVRPKTNDFHKRRKKKYLSKAKAKASNQELFEEFNNIINSQQEEADSSGSTVSDMTTVADLAEDISTAAAQSTQSATGTDIANESEAEPLSDSTEKEENTETDQLEELNETEYSEEQKALNSARTTYIPAGENMARYNQGLGFRKLRNSVIAFLLISLFLIPAFRGIFANLIHVGADKIAFWKNSELELPQYSSAELSFPRLPSGVYSGSITGLFPDKDTPLMLISFEDGDKVAALIGIEGWLPKVVDMSEAENASALKFKLNGMLLELHGEVKNGKITGYFNSLINGSNGSWSVEPAT